ncbi:hypothetical protein NDU88_000292 [Pleurodeles waltl]|uniref:KRAB domain-containing protein n=1 Tax=Pleurodeles waltl TaxID=8319 RepID=A0AAV7P5A0_PLEWA|nr:hypothetical protein NDU88_000292 [Pleurodeles waltl]
MKHRRAAPQGAPEQEPVTFIDVVSCFSEEEWKLLHNWQKELYRNVMKDIHQALLSLGPMIANSVFSLNPKGHEELCDMDFEDMKFNRDLKTFQGYSAGESNALSRKTRLAKQHLKNISDTNERGSCDRPSTAGPMMASSLLSRTPKGHEELCNLEVEDIKLNHDVNTYRGNSTGDSNTSFRKTRIASEHLKDSPVTNERGSHDMSSTDTAPTDSASLKEECDVETLDYSQPQGTKCPSGTTRPEVTRPAVSVSVVDDEESYAIETQDYGEEDVSSPVEPGDAMPYVPMGINEEGETYPIDIEDYGKSEGTSSYVGHEAAGAENKLPYKVSSEKIHMFPASEKDPGSRSYVWPGSDWSEREMKSEKHESDFDDSTQSSLHHWTPKEMLSMGHSERDGGLFNVQIFAAQSDLENTGKPCTYVEKASDKREVLSVTREYILARSLIIVLYVIKGLPKSIGSLDTREHTRERGLFSVTYA